jgi:2-polyprenyl-6-methoxyphenol hydroxylase-like FAD-dependent oxidoreductase
VTSRRTAIVVGGGPAGAAAALGLLRRDFTITLIEQRAEWGGRVCGAFLDVEAVRHLRWLGLTEAARGRSAVPVEEVLVTSFGGASARLSLARRGLTGLALPRRNLEEMLLEEVDRQGGEVLMGWRVVAFVRTNTGWNVSARETPRGNGPRDRDFSADLLVLGDGRFSIGRERPWTREGGAAPGGWYGWNVSYEDAAQRPGELSLHFYPGGYVGVLTFAGGISNVCGLRWRGEGDPASGWEDVFEDARSRQRGLARILAGGRRAGGWRGVGPLPFGRRATRNGEPLRVGDAAAVGDPFMGEGIGRALASGPLLWTAVSEGSVSEDTIRTTLDRMLRRNYSLRRATGSLLRRVLSHPSIMAPAMSVALRFPRAAERLLPIFHGGGEPGAD